MADTTLSRRQVLRMTATAAAVPPALLLTRTVAAARDLADPATGEPASASHAATTSALQPFELDQVELGPGIFRDKRDRMLNFARNYPGTGGMLDGPDRMLYNFRANAGLPNPPGATWPGGWDTPAHLLRGHYSGHYMTLLAQSYASTGEQVFRDKLDYMVQELGVVQATLAARIGQDPPEPDPPDIDRVDGRFGSALRLNGPSPAQYVAMPTGIVSGLSDFTIAAWVNIAQLQSWTRIFDFGTGTGTNMFLTVRPGAGAGPRFAITTGGSGGEQRINGNVPLAANTWTHVAVTLAGSTGTLYVGGVEAGTATLTLRPSDLGNTTNNWICRSQYNDPLLNAAVDEFHIFDRALTEAEIAALTQSADGGTGGGNVAWYRFDEEGGATVVDSSSGGRDATVIAPADEDEWWAPSHPGYLSAFPEDDYVRLEPPQFQPNSGPNAVWAPWYTFHKILRGLLDAHEHTGNDQALQIAFGMGDWAHSRLSVIARADLDRMWNIYSAGETGGANEAMADLSRLADDADAKERYLVAAKAFDFTTMKNAMLSNQDILGGPGVSDRHANTFVPPKTGYIRIYEQTGEADYLTIARNFWRMVVPDRIWCHGGTSGPGEFFRERGVIAGHLRGSGTHFAETCTAYNMLKLTRNLFLHDSDPAYMDYYEQGLHNQILGSRRDVDSTTSPWVTYHQNVWPGASRGLDYSRYGQNGSCCTGTGLENHTKYQETVFFRSADGSTLYVNLFIAASLRWQERGFVITQTTGVPAEGTTRLTFDEGGGPLAVKLRVPHWVRTGYAVSINGVAQTVDANPGSYVTISRMWRQGDRIEVSTPLHFRIERTPDDPAVQSIFYGPSLLMSLGPQAPSGEAGRQAWRQYTLYRHFTRDGNFARAFAPTGTPLQFTSHGFTFIPYHVADPGTILRHHTYFERVEPTIVFGSNDTGVDNHDQGGGWTFLDEVWVNAPFGNHGHFVSTVARVAEEAILAGRFTDAEKDAVVSAAARARNDLTP